MVVGSSGWCSVGLVVVVHFGGYYIMLIGSLNDILSLKRSNGTPQMHLQIFFTQPKSDIMTSRSIDHVTVITSGFDFSIMVT